MAPLTPPLPSDAGPREGRLRRSAILALAAGFLAVWPWGCGYSLAPLTREGIRAVHVPLFENRTNRRELEFALTDEVSRELRRAGYRLAAAGGGDAVLEGTIVEVREEVQFEDPRGETGQGRVTVAVEWRLRGRSGGRTIAGGRAAEGGETVFARGEDRSRGLDRAVKELARTLVRGLEPPPPS